MRDRKKFGAMMRLGLGILGVACLALGTGQWGLSAAAGPTAKAALGVQSGQQKAGEVNQSQAQQAEKNAKTQEKVKPAFKNIKEKTAAYVFLGWIWVSIFVLIYFLRQKINEVDRLYRSRFFNPPHPPGSDSPSRP